MAQTMKGQRYILQRSSDYHLYHQRNEITYFDVPVLQSLLDIICKNIEYRSTVFTDEYRAYDQLEKDSFIHKSVIHSQKEYANGTVHVNNCECRSNLYQIWIRKSMGVNKYNLQVYSKVVCSLI